MSNIKVYMRTLPNALHNSELDKRFLADIVGFYMASQSSGLSRSVRLLYANLSILLLIFEKFEIQASDLVTGW